MKNIRLLSTDKPSRLVKLSIFGKDKLHLCSDILPIQDEEQYQHIYITSDEEIKDDDWVYCPVLKKPVFICLDSILMFKNLGYDSNGNSKYKKEWLKKIILTTDPDLIKDGVQAIDDEFLEWFVNNPSCEEIELEEIEKYKSTTYDQPDIEDGYNYKIIIPKEEPKQETLEEVAHEMLVDYGIKSIGQSIGVSTVKKLMVDMAKWQAERMYSEKEVFNLCREFAIFVQRNGPSYKKQQEWFEQFKKK